MKLKQLLNHIPVLDVKGNIPEDIKGLSNDSREVKKGSLFFAIDGYQADGHTFISNALLNGATVAIVERFVDVDIPQILTDDSRFAMAHMSSAYYGEPSKKICLTGITATNGKTSTAFMLDDILKVAEKKRAILGTVKTEFEGFEDASLLTTPESLTLQSYFKQMVDIGVTHATMEVSSIGLELKRVEAVDFDVVTLNNISNEHTDLHGSHEHYIAEKSKLITQAKADAVAVLNLDDEVSKSLINQTKAQVITYGYDDTSGDLVIKDFDMSSGLPRFKVELTRDITTKYGAYKKTTFEIKLGITGFYNVMNSLVAIGASIAMGINPLAIEQGLMNYHGVERRCQLVYNRAYSIIDDHFANEGNIDVTMKTLSLMAYKQIRFVYAIRGSRGVTTNAENAHRIVYWAKTLGIEHVYATLSKGHVTIKDEVTKDEIAIFEQILTQAKLAYTIYDALGDSIVAAIDLAVAGDIVLLAGCQGMDCGAHIALKYIAKMDPSQKDDDLFKPIVDRICCSNEVLNE